MGQLSLPQASDSPAPAALAAADAERVRQALAAALAENTRRAYLGHWAAFSAWCGEHGYSPAPAAAETVAAHLAAIAEDCSASTLKVRRAAVGAAHRAAGLADPAGSELVRKTLAGLVRERAAPQRQARALGLAELAAIKATACAPRTGRQSGRTESKERALERGRTDIALCAVLFYAGLRRSEAAAIAWGDVETSEDGSGLLTVRRSKTDPEARGQRALPAAGGDGGPRGDASGGRRAGGSGVWPFGPADGPACRGRRDRGRAGERVFRAQRARGAGRRAQPRRRLHARDRRGRRLAVRRHGDPLHAPGNRKTGCRGPVPRGPAGTPRLIRQRRFSLP